jgi:hypothetical protein
MVNAIVEDVPPISVTATLAVPADAISLAGTAAVSCVELTYVVVSAVPFQFTTELETKFVPVTVSVKAAPAAVAELGESIVTVGIPTLTVKDAADEVPPASVTVTLIVPPPAMSLAGTAAVSCVELTYVVVSAVPFQFTTELETKFVPVTVSVKAAPPAVAVEGESVVTVGVPTLTVKDAADEVPPESVTVMLAVPALAMSLAGTAAVSCVGLTYVVVSAVPFQFTVAPETKFVPVTVSVKAAPPAVIVEGESVAIVGVPGKLMVKTAADEAPAELVTVTLAVPVLAMSLAETAAASCVELT